MLERLQKILSSAGVSSRRAAEGIISEGRVHVNGVPALLGQSADPEKDRIEVDGRPLSMPRLKTYIMLNKPRGYVTTMSDEKGRRSVSELTQGAGARVYPVGRLDLNSEGLLILTNDGEAAFRLSHPSHRVKKTYHVWVRGENPETSVRAMTQLREIDGRRIGPAQVQILTQEEDGAKLSVTIGEGRNRQVRKMCAKAGLQVLRLMRVAVGDLALGDLPPGKWRFLTDAEIEYLRSNVQ